MDADAQSPVGADMRRCFVQEWWNVDEFRRKYPKAKVKNWDSTYAETAPAWGRGNRILLAEYWCIKTTTDVLLLVQSQFDPSQTQAVLESELDGPLPAGCSRTGSSG
jgi:hypothetical protein